MFVDPRVLSKFIPSCTAQKTPKMVSKRRTKCEEKMNPFLKGTKKLLPITYKTCKSPGKNPAKYVCRFPSLFLFPVKFGPGPTNSLNTSQLGWGILGNFLGPLMGILAILGSKPKTRVTFLGDGVVSSRDPLF